MTLFTDEPGRAAPKRGRAWKSPNGLKSIIKQPSKVWSVTVFRTCTTSVTDFPTDGESCCLILLCLCDASVIKDLQGLENASLWAFFFLISQHENIKIPFFSDLVPNYLSSKTEIRFLCQRALCKSRVVFCAGQILAFILTNDCHAFTSLFFFINPWGLLFNNMLNISM